MLKGGDVPYLFEKDRRELERLNQQHFLIKNACAGHNFFVPVKRPRRILDVASGTGIWGREIAEHFRQATVWNTDKDDAVYEQAKRVIPFPSNWRFQPWSYPDLLPFEPDTFDYVHARLMGLFVPAARWPAMIGDMLRVTRPGGWVGMMESGLFQTKSATANLLTEAGKTLLHRYGLEPETGPRLEGWAREAGVGGLKQKVIRIGTTLKQRDALVQHLCAGVANASESLIQAGLFSRADMENMQFALPLELRALGVSINFYVVWGQKPR